MRAPLEKIELVDKYLSGTLTPEEQSDFSNALKTDIELKQLLDIQQTFIQAAKRKALRAEIKTSIDNLNPWKKWWKWITGGVIIAGVVTAFVLLNQQPVMPTAPIEKQEVIAEPVKTEAAQAIDSATVSNQPSVSTSSTRVNQDEDLMDFNGLKTWTNPDVQKFSINPLKGLTIEGKQGTLIIVPKDAFVDENNQLVKEQVSFQLVEATTLQDMVLYNLGTTADGKPLESGGMLYMDFTSNGKKVKVNPKRPLYVEVPTKEVKKGMCVFKGEVEQGKVNWKDPKPLKKYLVNVDFKLLDFLPQGFANEVQAILPYKGHKTASSELVDSLYYSLERSGKPGSVVEFDVPTISIELSNNKFTNSAKTESRSLGREQLGLCGIAPITIKTIKTPPYAKTFIATREFEQRVKELHTLKNGNELLQLYLNNLAKNLSTVDSIVALKMSGREKTVFNSFAAQGLTNIKDAAIYQDQLSAYYTKKKKEFEETRNRLRKELKNKNDAAMKVLEEAYKNAGGTILSQKSNTIITPLTGNLSGINAATSNVYAFEWAGYGWVNIDYYLHLLAPGADEVQMLVKSVPGTREVYQWLNTINNLTPLKIDSDKARALFPKKGMPGSEEMKNTFCFAISRENGNYQWFDLRYNPYETKTISVQLQPSTLVEIKAKLKSYGVDKDMEDRLNTVEKEVLKEIAERQQAAKRAEILASMGDKNKELSKDEEVMNRLGKIAFRCGTGFPRLNLSPGSKSRENKGYFD